MRIRRTEELPSHYPPHMLWVPMQDVREAIEEVKGMDIDYMKGETFSGELHKKLDDSVHKVSEGS